jgi:hypothetical protein
VKRVAALVVLLAGLAWPGVAEAAYTKAVLLYNLQDANITESSGVASASYSNDVYFTHNDSGDYSRFFAFGPRGRTIGTFSVVGAGFFDWEDMARAGHTLYFGDIGDNYLPTSSRPDVTIYEVDEPHVNPADAVGDVVVPITARTDLVYEDGPHNAETLVVEPRHGTPMIVTKDEGGVSGIYAALPLFPGFGSLHRIATIDVRKIARPYRRSDYDRTSRLLTTGGDISSDGRRLVVRTYVEAFEWDISKGIARGLRSKPLRIPLPFTKQGESIAYTRDGRALVTTSEQLPTPVHLIR